MNPPPPLPIPTDSIVDTVREPLLVLTADLRVQRANRSFYRTFAVTPQETEGRLVYELGNGQWDIPALRQLLESVLPERDSFDDFEVAHDFPSVGRKVMLLNARRVVGDGNGDSRAATILLAIEDITERRRLEDERRELETRFTSLVKNVRDHSIFTLDPQGRITSWNVEAGRILGFNEAEVLGRHFSIIFTDEDKRDGIPEHELRTALSDGRAEDERWHLRKGGYRFWALGIVTPTHDASGGHTGFSKILRDMTDRKRAEEERERLLERETAARAEAERAMTVRDEFLAVVSHELRTPLSAILLYAKMLRVGAVKGDAQAEALDTILKTAEAQRRLIEDLLDVSRAISGKLRVDVREADPVSVVQAAVEAARPMADANGVTVEVVLDGRIGQVRADPDRIQQVVWNLLNNAVKFTGRGGGRVRVGLRRLDGAVEIRVSDTGRGIKPEFLPHVFDRFRQEDASTTRAVGGLGLGLAISRQLIELHGGTIRAESAGEGAGATFTVTLPLAAGVPSRPEEDGGGASDAGADRSAPSGVLAGVRVLVVEDDAAMRKAVRWVLEQSAAEVTAVGSVDEALAAFAESLTTGRRFDVVASDIGLPGKDGYELIREVRRAERGRGDGRGVPAVALSAYTRDVDRAEATAAGFDAHVAKPVEPGELVAAVSRLAARQRP